MIAEAGGPRQPWHDWHCKIEGPASYDILTNFEQCWRKATRLHDDELVNIDKSGWILGPSNQAPLEGDPAVYVTDDYDEESWHVQVSSSCDHAFRNYVCVGSLMTCGWFYCKTVIVEVEALLKFGF